MLFKLLQTAEGDGHRLHRRGGQAQGAGRPARPRHGRQVAATGLNNLASTSTRRTSDSSEVGRSWVWQRSSPIGSDGVGSAFQLAENSHVAADGSLRRQVMPEDLEAFWRGSCSTCSQPLASGSGARRMTNPAMCNQAGLHRVEHLDVRSRVLGGDQIAS